MKDVNSPESAHLRWPDPPTLPARVKLAMRTLRILRHYPGDTIAAPLLNESIDFGAYARILEELKQTDTGRDLLERRPSLQGEELDLEALGSLPEATLGRAVARYFRENGLEPFTTKNPIRSDLDYISKRYRETHDFYHVITGYQTDPEGEMELQAFVMGNLGIRTPLLILPFGTVGILKRPEAKRPGYTFPGYLGRVGRAFLRGRRTRSFFAYPFESRWETPLEEVRLELLGADDPGAPIPAALA